MQYVYGDDTSLLNAIAKVVERKKHQRSGGDKSDAAAGDGSGDDQPPSPDSGRPLSSGEEGEEDQEL